MEATEFVHVWNKLSTKLYQAVEYLTSTLEITEDIVNSQNQVAT